MSEVPPEMKANIAKFLTCASIATDSGQRMNLTSSAILWVEAGVKKKYDGRLPDTAIEGIEKSRDLWMDANTKYSHGAEFWYQGMFRVHDALSKILEVAVLEDIVDYKVVECDLTSFMAVYNKDENESDEVDENPNRRVMARG